MARQSTQSMKTHEIKAKQKNELSEEIYKFVMINTQKKKHQPHSGTDTKIRTEYTQKFGNYLIHTARNKNDDGDDEKKKKHTQQIINRERKLNK